MSLKLFANPMHFLIIDNGVYQRLEILVLLSVTDQDKMWGIISA